jgi:hypothetical protein
MLRLEQPAYTPANHLVIVGEQDAGHPGSRVASHPAGHSAATELKFPGIKSEQFESEYRI